VPLSAFFVSSPNLFRVYNGKENKTDSAVFIFKVTAYHSLLPNFLVLKILSAEVMIGDEGFTQQSVVAQARTQSFQSGVKQPIILSIMYSDGHDQIMIEFCSIIWVSRSDDDRAEHA